MALCVRVCAHTEAPQAGPPLASLALFEVRDHDRIFCGLASEANNIWGLDALSAVLSLCNKERAQPKVPWLPKV